MARHMTPGEAARELGVTKGTITRWSKLGLLYPIESIDVISGRRQLFFATRDVKFLSEVVKSLPPDKQKGRHILYQYQKMVEQAWEKRNGRGH